MTRIINVSLDLGANDDQYVRTGSNGCAPGGIQAPMMAAAEDGNQGEILLFRNGVVQIETEGGELYPEPPF
jgi:hypothetical protein